MPTNQERREAATRKLEQQIVRRGEQARRRRLLSIAAAVGAVVLVIGGTTTTALMRKHDGPAAGTAAERVPGELPPFTPSPDLGADCQYPAAGHPAKQGIKPPRTGKVPTDPAEISVSMMTDQGPVGLLLANAKSPCTVNSFVSLVNQDYFNDSSCTRLTTDPNHGVLQCGDPTGKGNGGPGYRFANEYPTDQYTKGDPGLAEPVSYPRGTLAMANAGPGTNGSQFFLVYQDTKLAPQYTIFGRIQDDGLATLDKIAAAGVASDSQNPTDGPPANKVTITSVRVD